jgi:hypothetical protein
MESSIADFGDSGFAGLGVELAAGRARAFLGGLASFSPDPGKAWALAADLLVNPYDSLLWESGLRLYGDFRSLFPYGESDSLEFSSSLGWELGRSWTTLKPYADSLLRYTFSAPAFSWEIEAGLTLGRQALAIARKEAGGSDGGKAPGGIDGFYSLRATAFGQGGATVFGWGPSLGVAAGFSAADSVVLRGRASGRYAANGAALGLGRRELYRGNPPAVAAPFSASATLEFAWLAEVLGFETGEILLVDSVELGPYIDLLWSGDPGSSPMGFEYSPEAFTAGLSLSATLRFAGLRPFDLSLFAGLDGTGDLAVGIRSGRLFLR